MILEKRDTASVDVLPPFAPDPLVHVVEDDPAVLESLSWLLEAEGYRVTRNECAEDLLARDREELDGRGVCVVTDLAMPGMTGLQLATELVRLGCRTPTLIVTGHGDIPTAVAALRAGCVDFLQKPYGDAELLRAVEGMLACISGTAPPRHHRVAVQGRVDALSPRESEVLQRVVVGRSNREVAEELSLSPKTVEAHRSRVMGKMRRRFAGGPGADGDDRGPVIRPAQAAVSRSSSISSSLSPVAKASASAASVQSFTPLSVSVLGSVLR